MWHFHGKQTMNTLRKCPFCSDTVIANVNGEHAECIKCGAVSHLEDWNTRPEEDRLRALLDEAVARLRQWRTRDVDWDDCIDPTDEFLARIAAELKGGVEDA
jgi:NMD protein affecting ribosome stability and mRNA decay